MTGRTCPRCGHVGHPTVVAGSRFTSGPQRYRAAAGGEAHQSRLLAEADACDLQLATTTRTRPTRAADQEDDR